MNAQHVVLPRLEAPGVLDALKGALTLPDHVSAFESWDPVDDFEQFRNAFNAALEELFQKPGDVQSSLASEVSDRVDWGKSAQYFADVALLAIYGMHDDCLLSLDSFVEAMARLEPASLQSKLAGLCLLDREVVACIVRLVLRVTSSSETQKTSVSFKDIVSLFVKLVARKVCVS